MSFFKNLSGLNKESDVDVANEAQTNNDFVDSNEDAWLADDYEEGQLAIDVYQTDKDIIVKSTIAGVDHDDIDIAINNDMLTIRGKREHNSEVDESNYFYQECYWGSFSRSIILPVDVQADKIDATIKNGILTVTLPKKTAAKKIEIKVKD